MIFVFVGPSLPHDQLLAALNGTPAVILPPAAQGDIFRCLKSAPSAIVLIDGYFHDVPAPWHKEILWVIKEGVPVYGASSMGALRAAELEAYGMIGVGKVFEDFKNGVITADDEVALEHGPAEAGYIALSVPLVNIRASLSAACQAGVISETRREALIDAAIRTHYSKRDYEYIIPATEACIELERLREWLSTNRIDQKALDAKLALHMALTNQRSNSSQEDWFFEHTAMWDDFVQKHSNTHYDPHDFTDDDVIDQLESDPEQYYEFALRALARMFVVDHAKQQGRSVSGEELINCLELLRQKLRLFTAEELTNWMDSNRLSATDLAKLLESEVHVRSAISSFVQDIEPIIVDQLKLSGQYMHFRQSHK